MRWLEAASAGFLSSRGHSAIGGGAEGDDGGFGGHGGVGVGVAGGAVGIGGGDPEGLGLGELGAEIGVGEELEGVGTVGLNDDVVGGDIEALLELAHEPGEFAHLVVGGGGLVGVADQTDAQGVDVVPLGVGAFAVFAGVLA